MNEPAIHGFDTSDDSDAGVLSSATDAELETALVPVVTGAGAEARLAKDVVRILGRLIPGENQNLPDAGEDYKYFLGLNPINQQLLLIEELRHSQDHPTGTFNDYSNSFYLGVRTFDPPNFTAENHFYYHQERRTFRARRQITHGTTETYIWQDEPPDILHAGHVVWLGHHNHEHQALQHVGTFNSNYHYYAYIGSERKVKHLQNNSYSAGTTITYTYSWTPYDADIRERLHALEQQAPNHWTLRLSSFEITGNDTVQRQFTIPSLKTFLDASDRHEAELILNVKATYDSALTGGTIDFRLEYDGSNAVESTQTITGTEVSAQGLERRISELDNDDDISLWVQTENLNPNTETLTIQDVELDIIAVADPPKVTSAEIQAGTETAPRGLAPSQYSEMVEAHETYPWSHSERMQYDTSGGSSTNISFRFIDTGGVRYMEFSGAVQNTFVEDWLETFEAHDEFAIVDETSKDEYFHGEIDGDWDAANRRIPVLGVPDLNGLTDVTYYLFEATRGAPDVGQELPRIREEAVEAIEPFAQAKVVSDNQGSMGEYIDKTPEAIPRDVRFANTPLAWRSEYLDAHHYRDLTDAAAAPNNLIFSIVDVSDDRYIRVDSETGLSNISNIEAMKKHDVLVVEATEGSTEGQIIAMFVALDDWDGTDGLLVETIFYRSSGTAGENFDYDNNTQPVNVYITAKVPEVPEEGAGGDFGSAITDLARSLRLRSNGVREWDDVLRDPQFDEIYKAGSTTDDYTEGISSLGTYSLKSGYDWRDYGEIVFGLGRSNWTRMFLVSISRDLWDMFTSPSNGFGADPANIGRIDMGGYNDYLMTVRMSGNNQFIISGSNNFNIRAIWGRRQGE